MSRDTIIIGAVMTAVAVILQAVATVDAEALADWRTWLVGVGVASARQVAIYALPFISRLIPAK